MPNANLVILDLLERVTPEFYKHWQYVNKLRLKELKVTISLKIDNYVSRHEKMVFNFDYLGFITDPKFNLEIYSIKSIDKTLEKNSEAINGALSEMFKPIFKNLNEDQKNILQADFLGVLRSYLMQSGDSIKGKNYRDHLNYLSSIL